MLSFILKDLHERSQTTITFILFSQMYSLLCINLKYIVLQNRLIAFSGKLIWNRSLSCCIKLTLQWELAFIFFVHTALCIILLSHLNKTIQFSSLATDLATSMLPFKAFLWFQYMQFIFCDLQFAELITHYTDSLIIFDLWVISLEIHFSQIAYTYCLL